MEDWRSAKVRRSRTVKVGARLRVLTVITGAALLAGCDGATGPGSAAFCQPAAPWEPPAQAGPLTGSWTPPATVPIGGRVQDLLAHQGDLYFAIEQLDNGRWSLGIMRWSGASYERPAEWVGTENGLFSVSLLQMHDEPTLLWSQEDSAPEFPTPRDEFGEFPNALYTLDPESAMPQRVWRSAGTLISVSATSAMDGRAHVAAAWAEAGGRPHLVYIASNDDTWSKAEPVAPGFYGNISVGPERQLWLVYIGAEPPPGAEPGSGGFNPVFLKQSSDGGCTWGELSVLHAGEHGAYDPILVFDAAARPHVFWLQDVDGDQYPDEIWWTRSPGEGEWMPPLSIAEGISGMPVSLQVESDGGGGIHIAASFLAAPYQYPLRPFYLMWDGDEWSSPEHLFGLTDASAQMALSEDGTLHLVVNSLSQGILHSMKER